MFDPAAVLHQLMTDYPGAASLAIAAASSIGTKYLPALISKAEGKIPAAADRAIALQSAELERFGLSQKAIAAVEAHEAADLRAVADRVQARSAARLAAPATDAPKTQAPPAP